MTPLTRSDFSFRLIRTFNVLKLLTGTTDRRILLPDANLCDLEESITWDIYLQNKFEGKK